MNIHAYRLYMLLRMALYNTKSESFELFDGINQLDWDELLQLAKTQGVRFIAYDGMSNLPAEYRPTSKFHLNWYMSVVQSEHRREHYIDIVSNFFSTLYQGGVKNILLLKGLTISQYYDTPARRESGDVDIFLFGDNKICDNIMRKQGITVESIIQKDSTFNIDGICVENHLRLFDEEMAFKREEIMYCKADKMLSDMFQNKELDDFQVRDVSCKQLSQQCAALYHILHLFRHTTCLMLVVRHFCDWVVLFDKYKNEIDVERLRAQLNELNLTTFVKCVERYCNLRLGYEPYIFPQSNENLVNEVDYIDEIIMLFNSEKRYYLPGGKALVYKYMRYKAYKMYFGTTSIFESFIPEIYKNVNLKLKKIVCSQK